MKPLILVVALIASGCAHVVSSNPHQVIIHDEMMDAGKSTVLAQEQCKQHNKTAVMTVVAGYWDRTYLFDCR
jgi:hypothetical protein